MSAATVLAEAYGESACLYETVLEVPRDATPSQLRKAYYKKCLRYHPDKQPAGATNDERDEARRKFAAISLAYAVLGDEGRRREYDESGDLIDDDDDLASSKEGMKHWTDYFDSIFPKVTTADIDAFEVKYKCSEDEEADVLKYYSSFSGDLNKMLECVMLSSDVDKERWVKDYIKPAIERGDVEDFGDALEKTMGCAQTKKRKARGKKATAGGKAKQEEEAEAVVEMKGDSSSDSDSDSEMSDTPRAEIVCDDDADDGGMGREADDDARAKENNANEKKSASSNRAPEKKKQKTTTTEKKKKKKKSPEDDLIAQIRGNALARDRRAGFDSMMAGLEERYGGGSKGSKGGVDKKKKKKQKQKTDGDIDDEEFARIQANLMKNRR